MPVVVPSVSPSEGFLHPESFVYTLLRFYGGPYGLPLNVTSRMPRCTLVFGHFKRTRGD